MGRAGRLTDDTFPFYSLYHAKRNGVEGSANRDKTDWKKNSTSRIKSSNRVTRSKRFLRPLAGCDAREGLTTYVLCSDKALRIL